MFIRISFISAVLLSLTSQLIVSESAFAVSCGAPAGQPGVPAIPGLPNHNGTYSGACGLGFSCQIACAPGVASCSDADKQYRCVKDSSSSGSGSSAGTDPSGPSPSPAPIIKNPVFPIRPLPTPVPVKAPVLNSSQGQGSQQSGSVQASVGPLGSAGSGVMLIQYGTSPGALSASASEPINASGSVSHSFSGLVCGTTYYYQVIIKNSAGLTTSSSVQSFTTQACPKPISTCTLSCPAGFSLQADQTCK